jgi:type I restriction enzyme M protein
MEADGYSLDDKRTKVVENDIPDIIERFHNIDKETERKRTEKSFLVDKQEIIDNNYDLSINKYKQVEYISEEYPAPIEILKEIQEMEEQITKGLKELEGMLGE